jgi:hypothetical protein
MILVSLSSDYWRLRQLFEEDCVSNALKARGYLRSEANGRQQMDQSTRGFSAPRDLTSSSRAESLFPFVSLLSVQGLNFYRSIASERLTIMSPTPSDSGSIEASDDELPSEKNANLIMGVSIKHFPKSSCQSDDYRQTAVALYPREVLSDCTYLSLTSIGTL